MKQQVPYTLAGAFTGHKGMCLELFVVHHFNHIYTI